MRIISLEYEDKETGWKLNKTEFGELTLLIGASGVGKTKILRAIMTLQEIFTDWSFCEYICWTLIAETGGAIYEWKGESSSDLVEAPKDHVVYRRYFPIESLMKDGELIALRNSEGAGFLGEPLKSKLAVTDSIIKVLGEEGTVAPLLDGMLNIQLYSNLDYELYNGGTGLDYDILNSFTGKTISKKEILSSALSVPSKLYLAFRDCKTLFSKVENAFISVSPNILEVGFDEDEGNRPFYDLYIKEKGVGSKFCMSSGMQKVLFYLAAIHLLAPGSIVLIDEIENGLGVNCMEAMIDAILDSELQFILTSHHPYIINEISMNCWKLVTRNGSNVYTNNASDINLGKSRHEAFAQLMNLPEFLTGNVN